MAIRRDVTRFARGTQRTELVHAATRMGQFEGPVRLVWGTRDCVSEDSGRDRSLSVMGRCCAFHGRFERQIQHTKGGGQCRPRRRDGQEQRA